MAEDVPAWRQMFDLFEAPMRENLGALTNSAEFSAALMHATQNWQSLNKKTKDAMTKLMHLSNIPAHSDITKLSRQVGTLTCKVDTLAAQMENMAETLDAIRAALASGAAK